MSTVRIWRGLDFSIEVRVWSDDARTVPVDVSGRSFAAVLAVEVGATLDPVATFVVDDADAATGVVRLSLSETVTAGLVEGPVVWDVVQTEGAVSSPLVPRQRARVRSVVSA